jgi:hypothetical protein
MLLQVEPWPRGFWAGGFRAALGVGGWLVEHGWIVSQQMVLTLARPATKLAANAAADKSATMSEET